MRVVNEGWITEPDADDDVVEAEPPKLTVGLPMFTVPVGVTSVPVNVAEPSYVGASSSPVNPCERSSDKEGIVWLCGFGLIDADNAETIGLAEIVTAPAAVIESGVPVKVPVPVNTGTLAEPSKSEAIWLTSTMSTDEHLINCSAPSMVDAFAQSLPVTLLVPDPLIVIDGAVTDPVTSTDPAGV